MRAARWLAAACAATTLAGCGPDVRIDEAALRSARPQTIAVLPFGYDAEALGPRAALKVAAIEGAVRRELRALAYLDLADRASARVLEARGWKDGMDAGGPAEVAEIGRALDVDALVIGEVTCLANLQGGLVYRQQIEGVIRLVDARTGKELARVEHARADTGGLLLGSGQSLEAIQQTLDNASDLGFVRLAERFAHDVVLAFPAPPAPATPVEPTLGAVDLVRGAGSELGPGDVIEVTLGGDPGLEAFLDLGEAGGPREVPLVEEAPGRYRGSYRVQVGDRFDGPVQVHARDRFGRGAGRILREDVVTARAEPLGPVRSASASRTAGGALAARWEAREGAARYRVYALERGGRLRLLGEPEDAALVAMDRSAAIAVAAANDAGQLGEVTQVRVDTSMAAGGTK